MEAIQLNLFGDQLDFDKSKPPIQEVQNGTRSLGTNGRDALETVSPEILQQTGEGRHFGEGTSESQRESRDMMGDLRNRAFTGTKCWR